MKLLRLLVLSAALLAAAQAQTAQPTPQVPAALPEVHIASPVADLAKGYAFAASQMSESRVVIYYRSEEKTVALKGIRSVRASGGVLLINLSGGDLVAISAERILLITDGGRTP
ncbi:MAG: hypothetical protein HYV95_07180 [Opitutae bacterium]|nr:hypothetical protein [Opitutae bacterium]